MTKTRIHPSSSSPWTAGSRSWRSCLYAGLLAIVLAPLSVSGGEPPEDRQVLGALSYRIHCLNCHGGSGTGDGPMAELFKIVPTDLTLLAARNDGEFPAERVYLTIDGRQEIAAHGSRQMPVWGIGFQDPGRDSDQEEVVRDKILDLVAYLKTLQVREEAEPRD